MSCERIERANPRDATSAARAIAERACLNLPRSDRVLPWHAFSCMIVHLHGKSLRGGLSTADLGGGACAISPRAASDRARHERLRSDRVIQLRVYSSIDIHLFVTSSRGGFKISGLGGGVYAILPCAVSDRASDNRQPPHRAGRYPRYVWLCATMLFSCGRFPFHSVRMDHGARAIYLFSLSYQLQPFRHLLMYQSQSKYHQHSGIRQIRQPTLILRLLLN